MNYFLLYLKGLAMGAADVVPGVSGGTIAFITGIYEELLKTISGLNWNAFKVLKSKGIKSFWKSINGNFILFLGAGIVTSVLGLSKLINYLLQNEPILVWSFFFGLIIASIVYIGRQIPKWNFSTFLGLVLGTAFIFIISLLPPLSSSDSVFFLFLSGFLASTAMILPGISGSFILLILGTYSLIINALSTVTEQPNQSFIILGPVLLGIIVGLMTSSRAIYYLLKNFETFTMALLTGFLVGSLYKIWPWKRTLKVFDKETEQTIDFSEYTDNAYQSFTAFFKNNPQSDSHSIKTLTERNVSPYTYELINENTSSDLSLAIISAIVGFSLIFIIEFLAQNKKHVQKDLP